MLPYRKMISKYGLTQSMSRKGNCFDNAAVESFFGTLKAEFFHLTEFDSIEQLDAEMHDYIHYYNHERIKLKLNGLSQVDYPSQFATKSAICKYPTKFIKERSLSSYAPRMRPYCSP